jgi:hypothetical protein
VVAVAGQEEGDVVDVNEEAVEGAGERGLTPELALRGVDGISGAAQLGEELIPGEGRQERGVRLAVPHGSLRSPRCLEGATNEAARNQALGLAGASLQLRHRRESIGDNEPERGVGVAASRHEVRLRNRLNGRRLAIAQRSGSAPGIRHALLPNG